MDILENMMELNIQYQFILTKSMIFFDRIKYLIMLKINIPYVYFHKYAKIKVNSDDSDDLPLKKAVIMHNNIIFIKSVFNENHKHYFYKVYLEKCSYI